MKWGNQEALHLLWLMLPIALFLFYMLRRRERLLTRMAESSVLDTLVPHRKPSRPRTRAVFWWLAVFLCLASLARPQWGYHLEEVKRRGMDIIVVLDTSRSMLAEDIKPNRLQQAKWAIKDIVRLLKGDRIGLVAFAGSSFLQCPLTIDYAAFSMTLDDVYCGIIPRGGTAIGQALEKAMNSFEDKVRADRAIILITDGEDHESDPLALIDALKKRNIRVYAVGVGTPDGELIPERDEQGRLGFVKNKQGEVVKSSLRESALQQVALSTGGIYVRSVPGSFGLDRIIEQGLAHLKRDELESRMVKAYEERFGWFLAGALVLLLFEAFLSERQRKPRTEMA